MMYVIAHHRIADPMRFLTMAEEPSPDRPLHWRLIATAPTRDGSACFSLWWADSADALQRFLDQRVSTAGSVECHEVDEENALGLTRVGRLDLQGLRWPVERGTVPLSHRHIYTVISPD